MPQTLEINQEIYKLGRYTLQATYHYLAWEVIIELWLGSAGVGGPHKEKRLGPLNSQKILRVPSSWDAKEARLIERSGMGPKTNFSSLKICWRLKTVFFQIPVLFFYTNAKAFATLFGPTRGTINTEECVSGHCVMARAGCAREQEGCLVNQFGAVVLKVIPRSAASARPGSCKYFLWRAREQIF